MDFEVQPFKENDAKERKVDEAVRPIVDLISSERETFYNLAYEAYPLGAVLFDTKRAPLTNAITREVFISSFYAIFNLFTRPGTFEYYLEVFRAIWGESVEIEFESPSAGVLYINVKALDAVLYDALARRIENNIYIYDEIMDHEGNNIAFQGTQGPKTQNETDVIVFELHCAGVFVKATLEIV